MVGIWHDGAQPKYDSRDALMACLEVQIMNRGFPKHRFSPAALATCPNSGLFVQVESHPLEISKHKRVLYEQVTDVKAFFLIRVFAFAVIALLLLSTGFVFALW